MLKIRISQYTCVSWPHADHQTMHTARFRDLCSGLQSSTCRCQSKLWPINSMTRFCGCLGTYDCIALRFATHSAHSNTLALRNVCICLRLLAKNVPARLNSTSAVEHRTFLMPWAHSVTRRLCSGYCFQCSVAAAWAIPDMMAQRSRCSSAADGTHLQLEDGLAAAC